MSVRGLGNGYDTQFIEDNQQCLVEANLIDKRLVRILPDTGPFHCKWQQIKLAWTGMDEKYYVIRYGVDGETHESCPSIPVCIAEKYKDALDAGAFDSIIVADGASGCADDARLHFGYTNCSTNGQKIYFVVHPNTWGPFQHRFREMLDQSENDIKAAKWAVGLAPVAVSAAAEAYMGGAVACATAGAIVTVPIAIGAAMVGAVASHQFDRLAGDYLRYIG